MKKKIISLLLVLSAFLITSGVSAKEMSKDDIKPGTYMIGTHLFTRETVGDYNGTLTVRYIMLAARTINSTNINDMIIYLKNSRGKWVNAVTNEEVTVPDKVDIYYENSVEEFLPEIKLESLLSIESGQWNFAPSFDMETSMSEKEYEFELYEKTNSGYNFVAVSPKRPTQWLLSVDATNEIKTYVGRLAITNSKGEKIYSDYSDEVIINAKDILGKPDLKYGCTGAACSIWINYNTELANEVNYVVYEKTNESYTEVGTAVSNGGENGTAVSITLTNEPKTYVTRFYITNSAGEKIYSDYSDEVIINAKDILGKPDLKYGCTGAACSIWINYNTELANEVNYVVYEKTNESYTEVGTAVSNGGENGTAVSITLTNEPKTYVTRFYITNSAGEKLYSDYSDEVIINAKDILGKPELTYSYDSNNSNILFETILGAEYVTEAETAFDYDIELYTKNNNNYNLVATKTYNTATGRGTIDIAIPSSATTYVVRVVVTNSASEKIYSDYSDEVIINAKDILGKPVLEYSYEASEGKLNFNLKSDSKYLTSPENAFDYSVELYEENGESFDLIKTEKYNTSTGGSIMSITVPSDVKTYKARLYIKNSNSEKIYSDYSNLIFIDPNGIIQLEEVAVVGYEEENKQKVTYKFKDDIYTKYTNIEVLYMYEGKTDWELYSDTITASEEFEIEQTFGQIPERISVRLYKEVDGQRVYTSGYTISYDSDTPLLTGSGVAVEPETNKRIASYMFKNDIYTKYTNIEVSYMYADWELYSDTIEANKVFSIKYDDTQTPSKIKVRLYKIENGQRVYSKDTIL